MMMMMMAAVVVAAAVLVFGDDAGECEQNKTNIENENRQLMAEH